MSKKKRGHKTLIKFSNRTTYTILAIVILVLSGVAVSAYLSGGPPSTFGHSVDELDLGFIAEEVGKYIPEIVNYDPEDPKYTTGMDYSAITPVLVEAIKEQQAQIEELRKQINNLRTEELTNLRTDEQEEITQIDLETKKIGGSTSDRVPDRLFAWFKSLFEKLLAYLTPSNYLAQN